MQHTDEAMLQVHKDTEADEATSTLTRLVLPHTQKAHAGDAKNVKSLQYVDAFLSQTKRKERKWEASKKQTPSAAALNEGTCREPTSTY